MAAFARPRSATPSEANSGAASPQPAAATEGFNRNISLDPLAGKSIYYGIIPRASHIYCYSLLSNTPLYTV